VSRPSSTELTRTRALAGLARQALAGAEPVDLVVAAAEVLAHELDLGLAGGFQRRPEGGYHLRGGVGWPEGADDTIVLPEEHPWVGPVAQAAEGVTLVGFPPADLAELGVVSGLAAGIATHGAPRLIAAFASAPRRFEPGDLHFVADVASILAGALVRARAARDLRDSEARSRSVLETIVDAVITIDADATVLSFNPAAERTFGYEADEVIGRNVNMLMPEPYHSEHDGYVRAYRETGRRKIIGIGREVTGKRKNGETFPMDLAVSEVVMEGRSVFTGVVRDITERRELERELLRIQEDERRRIGQDLHDGLGQMLTGTGLITRQLARRLRSDGSPAADEADEVVALLQEADRHARSLARGLVPVDLEADGLTAALARLCRQAETLFGIECPLTTSGPVDEAGRKLAEATHIYRIAQEAISNGVRHGRARRVAVALAAGDDQLRLRVEDDGTGIGHTVVAGGPVDSPAVDSDMGGMGVRIMHYRARILGGTLEIRPGAAGGTVVTCTVPLRRAMSD
jgi:PAS domain S-box-containing protein